LIKKGNLLEAEKRAKALLAERPDDNDLLETYIGVLLNINTREKAATAWHVLKNSKLTKLKVFTTLGYKLWELGTLEYAIEAK
jgi:predicted Zn-dependent protease